MTIGGKRRTEVRIVHVIQHATVSKDVSKYEYGLGRMTDAKAHSSAE
jgi:hypothetical protein